MKIIFFLLLVLLYERGYRESAIGYTKWNECEKTLFFNVVEGYLHIPFQHRISAKFRGYQLYRRHYPAIILIPYNTVIKFFQRKLLMPAGLTSVEYLQKFDVFHLYGQLNLARGATVSWLPTNLQQNISHERI